MSATVLASQMRALRAALNNAGVAARPLFEQAGLADEALDDANARYPVAATARLWRLAVQATGDAAFGLSVAAHYTPTSFHALGYSLLASATLRDAFERIARYFRLSTDAGQVSFALEHEHYCLRLQPLDAARPPPDEALDAYVYLFVRFCRMQLGRAFSPQRIRLARPRPQSLAAFERRLRAPLEFNAGVNELWFEREAFERPLQSANPELARLNDEIVVRYLARFARNDLRARVREAVIERLTQGEPSAASIAQALHLSLRSLQRKLAEEGASYDAILTDTRRELALSYLVERGHSVSEITYLLGFADTSSFTRAFKRWTGQTPSAYLENAGKAR